MSVVATKIYEDRIVIGADSFLGRGGGTQVKDQTVKLFKSDDNMIVGTVGHADEIALYRLFLKTHRIASPTEEAILENLQEFRGWIYKKTDQFKYELGNSWHLAFSGKAFYVTGLYVREITNYDAIGAGRDFALAALHLGHSVRDAIGVACELSCYCETPAVTLDIPR